MANPIGICDSGSGGLTVLKAIQAALPGEAFVYLGDHKRAPYGHRSDEEILEFTIAMVETLFGKGCRLVVVACNTASAVALRQIQEDWLPKHHPDKRVLGVLVPMVEALTGLDWDRDNPGLSSYAPRNVAVFATSKTVDSGAYPHQVRLRAPKFQVIQQPCPGLVGAIEAGEPEEKISALIEGYCQKLAKQMVGERLDAVFLGCTHYPLVENLFRKFLPEGVEILDQPEIVAASLKTYLEKHPEFKAGGLGETLYFTTGKPADVRPLGNLLTENNIKFQESSP